ncbi:SDR family oxidoreductase [Tenggerimyces flavus]|uniref:SDR family oxidoreductase n=1 Tax=Tenggerimyces flavus TaxID=1708749 RepID=A0ABV7YNM0_9ACTN|nr:SDR family oxidoreductase [Tenggerimyces flavus]MBM7789614.1 NAD(P)-dependent dehydrogenase (short-subunit alcohol dehydrogenase family) [Tenggerimyces flavus]
MRRGLGRLSGKVAVVTGGASGIGAAMCRLFAREGAAVCVADVNGVAGREVLAEIREAGGDAIFLELNVADPESVAAAVDTVAGEYGRLDVFVNNAGIGSQSSGDAAGWWRLLRINALGVAWGMREAIRLMRDGGGGSIVNTGSHAGLRSARAGVYGSSKAAVHTLTRYAALAHAPDHVRVNAVLPGNIYTPIHDLRRHEAIVRLMEGDQGAFSSEPMTHGDDPREARENLIEAFREIHPLGELATAEDVAEAALYLASDAASIVTGNEFLVNGGIMAMMLRDRLATAAQSAVVAALPPPDRRAVTAIVSANQATAAALVSRLEKAGHPAAVSPDPTCTDKSAVRTWLESVGPLAGIVFAARPDPGGDLFSQGPAEWADELAADFRVPWVLANAAVDVLPAGGAVTFVADAAGLTGAACSPAFGAANAALIYATDDLSDTMRQHGVRLNTVIAEATSSPAVVAGLGAPSSKEDLAEVVVTVMRESALTGLQVSLQTSHPFDRPML